MNANHFPNNMITTVLITTVLFTGIISTVSAGEREGFRSHDRQKNERQDFRDHKRSRAQESNWNKGHKEIHRRHEQPSPHVIHVLPSGFRTVKHGDRHYYYHNGVFYNRHAQGYVVVEKPRFYHLPYGARRVVVNRIAYFVCSDVYYHSCGDYYEICEAPVVERVVVCPQRYHHSSSISINAGPVTVVLSNH